MNTFAQLLPVAQRSLAELLAWNGARHEPGRLQAELRIRNIGRAAGRAHGAVVTLNAQLVDYPDQVRNTLAHELAHVVVDEARKRLRIRHRRGDWAAHGPAWQAVARQLGDSGDRCHRLPLKPSRTVSRYLYRLPDGTERILSATRHNRLQRHHGNAYHFRGDPEPVRRHHFVGETSG